MKEANKHHSIYFEFTVPIFPGTNDRILPPVRCADVVSSDVLVKSTVSDDEKVTSIKACEFPFTRYR